MKQHSVLTKYKLSTVNCQLSIILLMVALFASPLKAQVKIGDVTNPQSYSILEIDTTQYKGGLRMPQLTTQQRDSLSTNVFPLAGNQNASKGLVIFNTDSKCLEYWNNSEWISLCSDVAASPAANGINLQTAGLDNQNACLGSAISNIAYSTTGATGATVTGLPTGVAGAWAGNAVTISGTPTVAGTFNYTVTLTGGSNTGTTTGTITVNRIPDTPVINGLSSVASNTADLVYSVSNPVAGVTYTWTVSGTGWTPTGGTGASITLTAGTANGVITVTPSNSCGSGTASTLNVTVTVTCGAYVAAGVWKEFMCYNLGSNYSADPFTPSEDINGDYYQWGSPTPGFYGPTNGNTVNGTWSSTAPATFYGDSTTNYTILKKSPTDPCPDGYRVPNVDEWTGVFANNTVTTAGTWTANAWSGVMIGDSLLLPAAGQTNSSGSSVINRGTTINYWSSTLKPGGSLASGSANATDMLYDIAVGPRTATSNRANGLSVRCIKEDDPAVTPIAGNITTYTDVMYDFQTQQLEAYTNDGSVPATYQWQVSGDKVSFTNIAGATASTYTVPAHFGDTYLGSAYKSKSLYFRCIFSDNSSHWGTTPYFDLLFIQTEDGSGNAIAPYGKDANGVRYLTIQEGANGDNNKSTTTGTVKIALLNLGQSEGNDAGDLGDSYQWGRIADGHEHIVWTKNADHNNSILPYGSGSAYTSDTISKPVPLTYSYTATGQIPNDGTAAQYIARYIKSSTSDWGDSTVRWGQSLSSISRIDDDPTQWSDPDNNPCKSLGDNWFIPSRWTWWDMSGGNGTDNSPQSQPYGNYTDNSWIWRSANNNIVGDVNATAGNAYGGAIIIEKNGYSVFLPDAGGRAITDNVTGRGGEGTSRYASSSSSSATNQWVIVLSKTTMDNTNSDFRTVAAAVRCVSQ